MAPFTITMPYCRGRDLCWQKVYAFTTIISWEKRPQCRLACEGGWPVLCGDCVNLCPARNELCSNQSGGRHTGLWLTGHTAIFVAFLVVFVSIENSKYGNWKRRRRRVYAFLNFSCLSKLYLERDAYQSFLQQMLLNCYDLEKHVAVCSTSSLKHSEIMVGIENKEPRLQVRIAVTS